MQTAQRRDTLMARGRARARTLGRPVLVSVAERVAATDPLAALEHAVRAAQLDVDLAIHTKARVYWTRPADHFAIAALGAAVSFEPSGADRFDQADRAWTTLIADAVIDDASDGMPAVGPTSLGGFRFDPATPQAAIWRSFPDSRLVIPRIQLTVSRDSSWLTTNVIVACDGSMDVEPAVLHRLRDAFVGVHDCEEASGSAPGHDDDRAAAHAMDAATPRRPAVECRDVRSANSWRSMIRKAVSTIRGGELEKVVLAREIEMIADGSFDAHATLRELQAAHATSYVFAFWFGDSVFLGATPERLVRVDGNTVQASSLAGSARRGDTPSDDAALARQLMHSVKDRSEHEIVRLALCAGLAQMCDDVAAPDAPVLLTLPHVHHLHTTVRARLRAGHTILQLIGRLHPTPAVGGAPRELALAFIREHERMDRGWYAAPIGWMQSHHGEFAVALRSAVVTGSHAALFAGCGVVADSDPDQEYAESLLKLRPMQAALAAAVLSAAPTRAQRARDKRACGEPAA